MEKNSGLDWLKDKFEHGKDEVVKLTKISKLRIEISSLNKKKEERLLAIGKRVVQLIEEGKISEDYFEPDYSGTVQFDEKIELLIAEIEEIKLAGGIEEDVEEAATVEADASDVSDDEKDTTATTVIDEDVAEAESVESDADVVEEETVEAEPVETEIVENVDETLEKKDDK